MNPTFADIVATKDVQTSRSRPVRTATAALPARERQRLLTARRPHGSRAGFTTTPAGRSSLRRRDGRRLVAVLLHGTHEPIAPAEQAAHLLDYGFPYCGAGGVDRPDR